MSKSILDQYLDQHDVTRYKVSKVGGVAESTLANTAKTEVIKYGVHVLRAIAKTVDKTPGQVLDELLDMENKEPGRSAPLYLEFALKLSSTLDEFAQDQRELARSDEAELGDGEMAEVMDAMPEVLRHYPKAVDQLFEVYKTARERGPKKD